MSRNQKLTPLLGGRTVTAVEPPTPTAAATPAPAFAPTQGATWHVRFADGSTLAVRTDGTAPAGADGAHGAAVTDVTQRGTTLTIAFGAGATGAKGGAALVFQTAEATACVMLRDAQGRMEYAD